MIDTPLLDPALSPEANLARLNAALRINKYMGGKVPTMPQAAFMLAPYPETLYGGAAGPGKSTGALFKALMYVDIKGYAALIVRRTFKQLSAPGGLMSKAREWLEPTDAHWNEETKTWTFPSGATLTFGHIEHPGSGPDDLGDETNYQGQEYQCIIPDELTQFPHPWPYLYLMTRLRRLADSPIPIYMGATSNPGGVGHEWVYDYFVNPATRSPGAHYIPALMETNIYLDQESYLRGLGKMDAITQAQLIDGNWLVRPKGDLFMPDRMLRLPKCPTVGVLGRVRYWDKAGTQGGGAYTAGVRLSRVDARLYNVEYVVEHIAHGQWSAGRRNLIMRYYAGLIRPNEADVIAGLIAEGAIPYPIPPDPANTVYWVEQEPGSGGKESAEITVQEFAGREIHTERPTGEKTARARAFAAQMEGRNIGYVDDGTWNVDNYLKELRAAPNGLYKDQWDGSAGGFNKLALLTLAADPVASPGRVLSGGLR